MKRNSETCNPAVYSYVNISEVDYTEIYRPHLIAAINLILTMNPEEFTTLSFEKIFSAVYKCVCSQLSDRLFNDLRTCVTDYLHKMVNNIREVQLTEEEFEVLVVEPYINRIMDMLNTAKLRPFSVSPGTMANMVKGLYWLNPKYAELDYRLFAIYIPNVLPPMSEDDLPIHAKEIQIIQKQMIESGLSRQSGPLKRPLDVDTSTECNNSCDKK
ncbi:CDK2-associated and cullin domain-containing protein 1 [Chamberlinius hualienensis]